MGSPIVAPWEGKSHLARLRLGDGDDDIEGWGSNSQ